MSVIPVMTMFATAANTTTDVQPIQPKPNHGAAIAAMIPTVKAMLALRLAIDTA